MISMSKFDIIQYLKDYANLQYLIMKNPSESFGLLFSNYMLNEKRPQNNNIEYYDIMRRVYMIYIIMRKFSFLEDYLLNKDNYLNDTELEAIIPNNLYKTSIKGLSKKKIIQLIRDGFNHNDSEIIDRFKISVNGKYIEIEFLNIPRSTGTSEPIKMKFSIEQLMKIYNDMAAKRQNNLAISFSIPPDFDINAKNLYEQLNNIRFIHYYFNKKLSKKTIEQFKTTVDTKGLSQDEILKKSEEFHNLSSSLNEPVKYCLSDDQIKKLISFIEYYRENMPGLLDNDINSIMYYFLLKVIPIPGFKDECFDNQLIYCERFMQETTNSLDSSIKELVQVISNTKLKQNRSEYIQETYNFLNERKEIKNYNFFKDLLDGEFIFGIPIITYIDAVFTHCCKEKIVKIGNVQYEKELIRNSFVHGRWYISTNKSIVLYDADPRNKNDYNLKYIGKLKLEDLLDWANSYCENNKKDLFIRR